MRVRCWTGNERGRPFAFTWSLARATIHTGVAESADIPRNDREWAGAFGVYFLGNRNHILTKIPSA